MFLPTITDLLTVNETAIEPPQEEGNHMNSPRNLALEATFINHNFSQQCLKMVPKGKVSTLVQPLFDIDLGLGIDYSHD